jgi:hypothetical protein
MSKELLAVIKEYRDKFLEQKGTQLVPANTCPLINDVAEFILDRDRRPGRIKIARKLEGVRHANARLRELGVEWYELCRDLLDALELTVKMKEKKEVTKIDKDSVVGQLMERVKEAKHELSNVEDLLRTHLLANAEFKVGDVVVIIEGNRKCTVGRVKHVRPLLDEGKVWYEVSPKTKNGFHASLEISVYRFGWIDTRSERLEKYDG